MPAASVIVPARNAAPTIGRTLAAIGRQRFTRDYEVIVVDNGSTDDTAEIAKRTLASARVVRKEPGGVGSGRNRGVAESSAPRIAFVDADCYPTSHWLEAGLKCLEHADLVQGAVEPDPTAVRRPFDRTVSVTRETGLYETANLFVTRELFERVGGFEDWVVPDLEAPFGEDVWFAWQAKRLGARTAFCHRALAHHAVFPRTAAEQAAERRRCEHFPAIAERVPELREAFFYRRWFLTRRTAAFDTAVLGAACAALARSPLPLAMALPYLVMWIRGVAGWRRHAPRALAGELLSDVTVFISLLKGSVRYRTPVI